MLESSEAAARFESLSFTVFTAIQRCLADSSDSCFPLTIAMLWVTRSKQGLIREKRRYLRENLKRGIIQVQLLTGLPLERERHEMLKGAEEQNQK